MSEPHNWEIHLQRNKGKRQNINILKGINDFFNKKIQNPRSIIHLVNLHMENTLFTKLLNGILVIKPFIPDYSHLVYPGDHQENLQKHIFYLHSFICLAYQTSQYQRKGALSYFYIKMYSSTLSTLAHISEEGCIQKDKHGHSETPKMAHTWSNCP